MDHGRHTVRELQPDDPETVPSDIGPVSERNPKRMRPMGDVGSRGVDYSGPQQSASEVESVLGESPSPEP